MKMIRVIGVSFTHNATTVRKGNELVKLIDAAVKKVGLKRQALILDRLVDDESSCSVQSRPPQKKPKKQEIALGERCQKCGRGGAEERDYYAKDYEGPCGDSFCYASCRLSACRPQRARLCAACLKKVSKRK